MALGVLNSAAFLTASQLAVAANATVEVRRESDSALASIFSDRAGTIPITNPSAFADASGRFKLYTVASAGGFSIQVTSGAESFTIRNVPIGTGQEFDIDEFWRTVLSAATKLAARIALKAFGLDGTADRATNTILGASDSGKRFVATGTFTQTFDAAATLGADWHVHYRVNSGQTVTLDPNLAETIDGAATKVVTGPAAGYVVCDGSVFHTFGFDQPAQPNASTTVRGIVELATQAEADAGTADRVHTTDLNKLALGTPIATTSGTAHNFTGIPSGTRRITVNFSGLSTNGTSLLQVQIGDSGGIEATTYDSASGSSDSGGAGQASTTGFLLHYSITAANAISGSLVLSLLDSSVNAWMASGTSNRDGSAVPAFSAGKKSLSATLDRVLLTTVNGTDTFDAGSVNIIYER